jgi:UDP-glucose 4-epimerase
MNDFAGHDLLITGGGGFFGSVLTEEMLRRGCRVTVLSRSASQSSRLRALRANPALTTIDADLKDRERVVRALEGKDFVWHLAGNTDIAGGLRDTSLDLNEGVVATHSLLEAMRQAGTKGLVYLSSAAVYGDSPHGFPSEASGPMLPISLYGAAKLASEAFVSAYSHLFGLQAWVFRSSNVIGGGLTHGVIRDFIQRLQADPAELLVLGDGTQTKSYLLAEECVAGMLHVVSRTRPVTPRTDGSCDIFNIGADGETLILDIARMVVEEMGLSGCAIRLKGGERGWRGDQKKIALDISRVRALGWSPSHTSDEAVRIAIRRILAQPVT